MTVQLRADVSTASSDLGMVLLDERSGTYWQLNRSGAAILLAVLDGEALDGAVDTVTATYDVERSRAEADARALLDSLAASGLVTS